MPADISLPVVMTIAGSDPTGGAGIQADIEAISSMGCHATAVVTTITVQDTTNVLHFTPQDAELVIQQARAILEDVSVETIKLGMLGNGEIAEAVHTLLLDYPDIPVVFDPIIRAGGGTQLADEELCDVMVNLLLPLATITTPNSLEARLLAPEADNLDACAMALLDHGTQYVLLTGSHEKTENVANTLYGNHRKLKRFTWERLDGNYHGSGCTLSSAIAALLAQGHEPLSTIDEAQHYTWQTLKHAYRIGMGQYIPNRFYWANDDQD